MLQEIYYSRKSGQAVQIIARCKILPEGTDAVCFQWMSGDFSTFVLDTKRFEASFVKRGERDIVASGEMPGEKGAPLTGVHKGTASEDVWDDGRRDENKCTEENGEVSDLIRFLDADTYGEKMKILEQMKDKLDEHILNNMAVSLDLSLEDGVDGYSFLMSELKIRNRFEGKRGERL